MSYSHYAGAAAQDNASGAGAERWQVIIN